MKNVFISHSSKDSALMKDLKQRLQKAGLHVFTETGAEKKREPASQAIDRRLEHLRNSDEVFVLLTENAVTNQQISFEIGAALSLRKKITPIMVGVEADKLPPLLKDQQRIQYAEMESYLTKLKRQSRSSTKNLRRSREVF